MLAATSAYGQARRGLRRHPRISACQTPTTSRQATRDGLNSAISTRAGDAGPANPQPRKSGICKTQRSATPPMSECCRVNGRQR
jgi:hypothetical protein